jgi:hypothetical protein
MSALGQKQTFAPQKVMSASGQKQTCAVQLGMSAGARCGHHHQTDPTLELTGPEITNAVILHMGR